MKTPFYFLLCAVIMLLLPSAEAQLEGTYEVAIKKKDEKKQSRWSLGEWLKQKEKKSHDGHVARAQFAFEFLRVFSLEAHSGNYGQNVNPTSAGATPMLNGSAYQGALAAYAGVAGLRGNYSSDTENHAGWAASFNIRLFGRAMQDTHINLEYGLAGLAQTTAALSAESFQNQFGAVSLNLYFTKAFGIEGTYRRLLPAQSDRNRTLEGESETAGAFIDFGLLRVFGNWRKEFLKFDGAGTAEQREFREGFGGGLRLYF